MKIIKIVTIFLALCLILPACSSKNNEEKYTGMLANEEVVSSIRQDIQDKENSLKAGDGDVFWTESGKLWHETYECSYLKNSKTILHGTLEEAKLEGKEKACDRCSYSTLDSIYNSLVGNEYKTGDVFFTKDDSVWHTNINCCVILGAQKIYFADIDTAKTLGKTHSCSECE